MSILVKGRDREARYERLHLRLTNRLDLAEVYDDGGGNEVIAFEVRRLRGRLDRIDAWMRRGER